MKKYWTILLLSLAVLSWVGWRLSGFQERLPAQGEPPIPWKGAPPDRTEVDPVKIFERAFWRRPTGEDQIIHAERHEWLDAGGVTKWQWFIEVKASAELLKYLRDDNAFGLIRGQSASLPDARPHWFNFKSGEATVMKSPQANLQLIFRSNDNVLFATDSGAGFRRGAPENTKTTPVAPVPGRLPTTPPPTPKP
jgi:hypothetical protein